MNVLNNMFEGNQNISHILMRMVEQNQEVATTITRMAKTAEKVNIPTAPEMKDASTQYYDETFDFIKTNFYWKLQFLASDEVGLDVLKRILKIHPNNFSELSEVFFESVEKVFIHGINQSIKIAEKNSPSWETNDEVSSEDNESTVD